MRLTLIETHLQLPVSVEPLTIGDQISLTGDTDHFSAGMRPLTFSAGNLKAIDAPECRTRIVTLHRPQMWRQKFVGHICDAEILIPSCRPSGLSAEIHARIADDTVERCSRELSQLNKAQTRSETGVIESSAYHLASVRIGPGVGRMAPRS